VFQQRRRAGPAPLDTSQRLQRERELQQLAHSYRQTASPVQDPATNRRGLAKAHCMSSRPGIMSSARHKVVRLGDRAVHFSLLADILDTQDPQRTVRQPRKAPPGTGPIRAQPVAVNEPWGLPRRTAPSSFRCLSLSLQLLHDSLHPHTPYRNITSQQPWRTTTTTCTPSRPRASRSARRRPLTSTRSWVSCLDPGDDAQY
jgi:hypothetical protein